MGTKLDSVRQTACVVLHALQRWKRYRSSSAIMIRISVERDSRPAGGSGERVEASIPVSQRRRRQKVG